MISQNFSSQLHYRAIIGSNSHIIAVSEPQSLTITLISYRQLCDCRIRIIHTTSLRRSVPSIEAIRIPSQNETDLTRPEISYSIRVYYILHKETALLGSVAQHQSPMAARCLTSLRKCNLSLVCRDETLLDPNALRGDQRQMRLGRQTLT